jgi:6-pyruvoyltetrahydropterin/6-carboxytetrahydropterin synthase
MKYTITKEFRFEAAHDLPQMPDGHKCKRLHGHSYAVIVELADDELDGFGFVSDYGNLTAIRGFIDSRLDHRNLSELFGGENTTAEKLCRTLYLTWKELYPQLQAVTIRETPSVSATYRP